MSNKQTINANLHAGQRGVIDGRKRFNVVRCGRRWGKSHLAFLLALETILTKNNARVLYTTPTFEDLKNRYREAVIFFQPLGAKCKEGQISVYGGIIDMSGVYRYDGLRGNKYHRFIGDEWAHSTYAESAWNEAIRATLSDYEGDGYFFSTPNGENFFKKLDDRSQRFNDWQSFHFTSYTNPYIKKSEIEAAKRELPKLIFEQEYLAEYISVVGALFKPDRILYDDYDCSIVTMGVDLAISQKQQADKTAISIMGQHDDGTVVVKYVEAKQLTFNEQQQWIKAVAEQYKPDIIAIENVQYQAAAVQELARTTSYNVVGIPANKDKVTRAQGLALRYEMGLVRHAPHLLDTDFEKQLFSFPSTTHDDMVDALVHSFNAKELLATSSVW